MLVSKIKLKIILIYSQVKNTLYYNIKHTLINKLQVLVLQSSK